MKILYDDVIFTIQKYGGISRYISKLIEFLSKSGNVQIDIARTKYDWLPGRLKKFGELFLDLRLNMSKYDIYHPTYYTRCVKKRKTVKTIVTVHDMIHELYGHRFNCINSGIELKKRSILNADHIICVSHNCKKDLQNIYDIKDDAISVVDEEGKGLLRLPVLCKKGHVRKALRFRDHLF